MDEQAFGIPTPHVSVRFMTRFSDDDPAIGRVGLIIERELQDGMRREILAAVRQAFRTQIPPYVLRIIADCALLIHPLGTSICRVPVGPYVREARTC